eukprot:CAMPEP_0174852882 /NCGR_PEP_ID=MMETSP1114-20130205/27198_1 /TAXON_ID=312471 /ORGANISM="Neobodo designis, Strain CCAP 1951/1" /LENGTH=197 /DNA_ID=CAMNT_0016087499 /DNA_START=98 /DNA_END=690 /DNA_ORIENTATION=-
MSPGAQIHGAKTRAVAGILATRVPRCSRGCPDPIFGGGTLCAPAEDKKESKHFVLAHLWMMDVQKRRGWVDDEPVYYAAASSWRIGVRRPDSVDKADKTKSVLKLGRPLLRKFHPQTPVPLRRVADSCARGGEKPLKTKTGLAKTKQDMKMTVVGMTAPKTTRNVWAKDFQPQEVVHLARRNFQVVRRLIVGAAFRL